MEHSQEVILKVRGHAVLGHDLVDAGHCQDAQRGAPARAEAVVGGRRRAAADRLDVAAKVGKVEDDGDEVGGDVARERHPGEEVEETVEAQGAEVLTLLVQRGQGLDVVLVGG